MGRKPPECRCGGGSPCVYEEGAMRSVPRSDDD